MKNQTTNYTVKLVKKWSILVETLKSAKIGREFKFEYYLLVALLARGVDLVRTVQAVVLAVTLHNYRFIDLSKNR